MFGKVSFGGKPTCPPPPPENLRQVSEENETDTTNEKSNVCDENDEVNTNKELVIEIRIRLE